MTIERSLNELIGDLDRSRDELVALGITVREDRPRQDDVALADLLADTIEEMAGWLQEGIEAAARARQNGGESPNLNRVWRSLSHCQQRLVFVRQTCDELRSPFRINTLTRIGHDRGGEWQAWVELVLSGLETLNAAIQSVDQSILLCWQEVGDRSAAGGVSVQNIQTTAIDSGGERVTSNRTMEQL